MKSKSANSLAPGFRFHPTDEELVRYYLKRKVSGKTLRFDPISEVDIYKSEPWDLPAKSRLRTRDLEWYFFSALDKKYGNGSKTNRATEKGYWKTTGKDRSVRNGSRIVGMKKTLVYHSGRAPRGERTNWVMHEYRLTDELPEKAEIPQDAFVLCRIFQKSGSGPKNGEQYGAPFVEEEWDDEDEITVLPEQEVTAHEVVLSDDAQFDVDDLDQNLNIIISNGDGQLPSSFYYGETSKGSEHEEALGEDASKPQVSVGSGMQQQDGLNPVDIPEQYVMNAGSVKPEDVFQSPDDLNGLDLDDLLDGTFLDASDSLAFGDAPFLQADDPQKPAETNPADFNIYEFFTFFDAEDNMYMANDSSEMMMGVGNDYFDTSLLAPDITSPSDGSGPLPLASKYLPLPHEEDSSSLWKQPSEANVLKSDISYKFPEKAGNFWDNLPAPPAFALEYPSKEAMQQLSSMDPSSLASSSSVQSTAGMLRIRNMTLTGDGVDWSFGKNGEVNLVVSFQLAKNSPVSGAGTSSKTAPSSGSWAWLYCMFLWAILVPVSFKFGSCMLTR